MIQVAGKTVWGLLAVPLLVLLAALVLNVDGHAVDLDAILAGVSGAHPLGTDALGRDLLARLAEGLTLSLTVGVTVVLLGSVIGISVGVTAAWMGGWVDAVLMRIADIVLSFPGILLAIALAAMLGPGVENLVLALKHAPFVEAAQAGGSSVTYIATRHLLPNIAAPLLVEASFGLAAVIIGEAGLSFLGVGVQPPAASLGTMIKEGTSLMLVEPLLVFWPGLILFMVVMAVNLLGDRLRDRLDVKSERADV